MNLITTEQIEAQAPTCAWCRSEYDPETGQPVRRLTDTEYDAVISHGMCRRCSRNMLAEYARLATN